MHDTSLPSADEFFVQQSKENPDKWKEVSERFPVNSKYSEDQIYYDPVKGHLIDESPRRRRNRVKDKFPAIPKESRRRLPDEEWEDYRHNKSRYQQDWLEDYYHAKELADQGM